MVLPKLANIWVHIFIKNLRQCLPLLMALGLFISVTGARWMAIERFGSDVPFWDQWGAEGGSVLPAWILRHELLVPLFVAHSEHRIVPTRALNLFLAVQSGQWDARVQCTINALLIAFIASGIFLWARRALGDELSVPICTALFVLFATPLDWENVVCGFQSQFYFLIGASLYAMHALLFGRPWSLRWWSGVVALAIASVSMGSGFILVAPVGVIAARRDSGSTKLSERLVTPLLCVAALALGFWTRPSAPGQIAIHAHTLSDFIGTTVHALAWPNWDYPISAIIWWGPLIALCITGLKNRFVDTAGQSAFIAAAGAWALAQIAAISYSRGAGAPLPASRYYPVMVVGLSFSFVSLATFTRKMNSRQRNLVLGLWMALLVCLARPTIHYAFAEGYPVRKMILTRYEKNLRAFSVTGNRAWLQREPLMQIPFFSGDYIEDVLKPKEIRALLPATCRAPLKLELNPDDLHGFALNKGDRFTPPLPNRQWWGDFPTGGSPGGFRVRSALLPKTGFSYFQLEVTGYLGIAGSSLRVVASQSGAILSEIIPSKIPGNSWRTVIVPAPREDAFLEASSTDLSNWFGFSDLVEMSALSRATIWCLSKSWPLFFAGLSLTMASCFLISSTRLPGRLEMGSGR